jgi:hypothetical protein
MRSKPSNFVFVLLILLQLCGHIVAGEDDFVPEHDPTLVGRAVPAPINRTLLDYYQAIKSDGDVSIFYGLGKDHFSPNAYLFFYNKLVAQFSADNLSVTDLKWADRDTLVFDYKGVHYSVRLKSDRESFVEALKTDEVVMYGGHSRYGVGPTFLSYDNYFRIGYQHSVIEVDTRTPTFSMEPILDKGTYPLRVEQFPDGSDEYQYRGAKDENFKLPDDSYTIRIEGNGKDLKAASFLPGKQLFFLKSCSNVLYWKQPLRDRFPDVSEKLFFGTNKDTFAKQEPFILFIAAILKETSTTANVLASLHTAKECGTDCFTAY